MKRHKTWYKRRLFKNHFKSYKNWDEFNPPSGDKQEGRYKAEALQCRNSECPQEGMAISEHEAFYCFASQSLLKRSCKRMVKILKKKDSESIYVCPFCGGEEVGEM